MGNPESIVEKVRFWQEQDRINKALIPRVMKIHELTTALAARADQFSLTIATVESRMRADVDKVTTSLRDELIRRLDAQGAETVALLEAQLNHAARKLRFVTITVVVSVVLFIAAVVGALVR